MVHRLSSNERAEERGREGVEWPGASANNGTESQGPARPLRINRKGLNKFSPWHSESIEFLTPYSTFVCFT